MKTIRVLIDPALNAGARAVIRRAAENYSQLGVARIQITEGNLGDLRTRSLYFSSDVLLTSGRFCDSVIPFPARRLPHFSVDPGQTALAAWSWYYALNAVDPIGHQAINQNRKKLTRTFDRLRQISLEKSYVFGTGPSIDLATKFDFADGYRVACNTICKEPDFFAAIDPHVIVAGDGLYHFSDTNHATSFRHDLHQRLRHHETVFLYPEIFRWRIESEFADVSDQCVALPIASTSDFTSDVSKTFQFAALGNVLGQMLLPVACSLSQDVRLLGFDGRKPGDKLFWANGDRVSYPGLIDELHDEYPGFFSHHVPEKDPQKYVKLAHGDALSGLLCDAENAGWTFTLLSPSTSPALCSRPLEALV